MPSLIKMKDGRAITPPDPEIPFIAGDGIGPEIWLAARRVFDAAVAACGKKRRVAWLESFAGQAALKARGHTLPGETLDVIRSHAVAIKGPIGTPVGSGFTSVNVALRKIFDLYACVRPQKWIPGVPAPVPDPSKIDFVLFRENLEDVYAGIEWSSKSAEAGYVRNFLRTEFHIDLPDDSGIGIKPMSEAITKRFVRRALRFALDRRRRSVTFVHKGNIMKFTEGAFRTWGYEVGRMEFGKRTVTEGEVREGASAKGKVVLKDRIADAMFQEVILKPGEHDVIVCPNLNGDYLSDACAALVGGLGMAPGANIGDQAAIFEATHGTAPDIAGKDLGNPSGLILSGAMMFEFLGWEDVAARIRGAVEGTVLAGTVTGDLARGRKDVTQVGTQKFGELVAAGAGKA
ncbi:MAG: NADP-dependent isocitrate dehydrogenase [Planctomycetes bacterium]|nr:NADP-dependent isocitrate dehydrogenase [Planctomycetota bacterium]